MAKKTFYGFSKNDTEDYGYPTLADAKDSGCFDKGCCNQSVYKITTVTTKTATKVFPATKQTKKSKRG